MYSSEYFTNLIQVILVLLNLSKASHRGDGICPFEKLENDENGNRFRRQAATATATASHNICDLMKPRRGIFPPQTSPCPWRIFIFKETIEQLHAQPVTLGSTTGKSIFNGFLITARKLVTGNPNYQLGEFLGHFEPQWDVIPHCCSESKTPNMLDGSLSARVKKANQTVLWTAPKDYIGKFVFVATVWKTVSKYWFEIKSPVINVIPRKQ